MKNKPAIQSLIDGDTVLFDADRLSQAQAELNALLAVVEAAKAMPKEYQWIKLNESLNNLQSITKS
jgi:hypothetical protein